MKFISPNEDYKTNELKNADLRHDFQNDIDEPIMFTNLSPQGYVGNRPSDYDGEIHEDDTWAIDQLDEDGVEVINSYLYVSKFEYEFDCKILGLEFKE